MIMRKTSKRKTGRKPAKTLPKGKTASPAKEGQGGDYGPDMTPPTFWRATPSDVVVVANLAAKLINGDDITGAVHRAIRLLECSAEQVFLEASAQEMEHQPPWYPEHSTFRAGAKEITGQKRADRAVEYLQGFMAAMVAKMPELKTERERKRKLFDWITKKEKEGFTGGELRRGAAKYRQFKKKSLR
jgi:hypothetical protein